MTTPIDISPEAVAGDLIVLESLAEEHDRRGNAATSQILLQACEMIRAQSNALTAAEKLLEIGVQQSAIKDCDCQVCLDWITEAEAILKGKT